MSAISLLFLALSQVRNVSGMPVLCSNVFVALTWSFFFKLCHDKILVKQLLVKFIQNINSFFRGLKETSKDDKEIPTCSR